MRRAALALAAALLAAATTARASALVLAFDDGYPNWTAVAAPELARVGGVATAYVNNQRIASGQIRIEDLRQLRDRYRWEIATHTFHHHDAPRYVQRDGLERWLKGELDASLIELRATGFEPRALAFPFNSFTDALRRAALTRVRSVRHNELIPLAAGLRSDGTIPGRAIDLQTHVPMEMLRHWVDEAARREVHLYLYAHGVLGDEHFASGQVKTVAPYEIGTYDRMALPGLHDLCLAPDVRYPTQMVIKVKRVTERTIQSERDLTGLTRPGAGFLVGPCYAMRRSDFRSFIEYAARRLKFLTVSSSLSAEPAPDERNAGTK